MSIVGDYMMNYCPGLGGAKGARNFDTYRAARRVAAKRGYRTDTRPNLTGPFTYVAPKGYVLTPRKEYQMTYADLSSAFPAEISKTESISVEDLAKMYLDNRKTGEVEVEEVYFQGNRVNKLIFGRGNKVDLVTDTDTHSFQDTVMLDKKIETVNAD